MSEIALDEFKTQHLPGARQRTGSEQLYSFPLQQGLTTLKTHSRSISHGSDCLPSSVPRPLRSAIKGGHQRAASHGQIDEERRGHSRVGSKTDFILPPGHKEEHPSATTTTSTTAIQVPSGHSRQASRSESIYTLRRAELPPLWKRILFFKKQKMTDHSYRVIIPNHSLPSHVKRKDHPNARYPSNAITTTKYNLFTFLPKNLFEQFHRIANLYFIFIVGLNWIPSINAFGKEISMLPVVFVLGVTAVKDLFEDWRRRSSDRRINNLTCRVYDGANERYHKVNWKNIMVGDLVHLSNNESVPADILVLRTSNAEGTCFIDTCDLDGETNLKRRQVAKGFECKHGTFVPQKFNCRVEVEPPTTKLYRFSGTLLCSNAKRISISTENLLLRESRLKNTDFIEGIVVYAGRDTKALLNNSGPRWKQSRLERQMNIDVVWCVVILIVLCVTGAFGCRLFLTPYEDKLIPFLPFNVRADYQGMLSFWNFIIILQVMIPISLYVTLELSKTLQVYYIHKAEELRDPVTDRKVICRAMNITEELGQIQYIFSDKTGTLTENKMIFRRCTINGMDFEHSSRAENDDEPATVIANPELRSLLQGDLNNVHIQRIFDFFTILTICNTVIVSDTPHKDLMNSSGTMDELHDAVSMEPSGNGATTVRAEKYTKFVTVKLPKLQTMSTQFKKFPKMSKQKSMSSIASSRTSIFEAESPDELALVNAAFAYDFILVNRAAATVTVSFPNGQGLVQYDVVKVLPFDSSRKCMSIVVKRKNSSTLLMYTKGADSTILGQLKGVDVSADEMMLRETVQQHLHAYSRTGLRVLVMAKRELQLNEFESWLTQHQNIETTSGNKEKKIRESFLQLERGLTLVGATGIEDKLQENVPETISALILAGITIWVLTGDKMETAINIAYSARLFTHQMELFKLIGRSRDAVEISIMFYLSEVQKSSSSSESDSVDLKTRALVVDGKTLTFILDARSNLIKPFLRLTQCCTSVLCVRATPLQKAYLVKIVKEELKMITLAIGDGANDVSMIQMADVGVGIQGEEGTQSVMASDFSIPRFKFLKKLLLVHGHWNYDRLARLILYFFYKNACFVMVLFWYQWHCGFSGSVMIDAMYLMLYNLFFTSVPPMIIGIYDKKIPGDILNAYPSLYRHGRLKKGYKRYTFWIVMLDAFYQSLAIYLVAALAYADSDVGIWEFGTTITSSCLITMLLHCAIEIKSWTILHVLSLVLSLLSFYAFAFIYTSTCVNCFGLPSNFWVPHQCMTTPEYYLIIVLTVVVALLPRYTIRVFLNTFWPSDCTRVIVYSKLSKKASQNQFFAKSWRKRSSSVSNQQRADNLKFRRKTISSIT